MLRKSKLEKLDKNHVMAADIFFIYSDIYHLLIHMHSFASSSSNNSEYFHQVLTCFHGEYKTEWQVLIFSVVINTNFLS